MQEHFWEEKGIYYRTNIFKEKRGTLVFVHGVSGSSAAWKKHEDKFKGEYNILTYDIRGHGKSFKYDKYEDYEIKKFVNDLENLVNYLKIDKFVLIPNSFGSLLALDYALTHQERLLAIIFLSINVDVRNNWLKFVLGKPVLKLAKYIDDKMHYPISTHLDYSRYSNTHDWTPSIIIANVKNTGISNYLYCSKQACGYDRRKEIEELKVPVLLIHGKKDTIFPVKNSIEVAKKLKNSKLVLLENADHIIVLNHFEKISKVIDDFLKEHNI